MTKFIIAGTQRTGTNFIRTMLNSHPHIHCIGEAFLKKYDRDLSYYDYIKKSCNRKLKHHFMRRKLIIEYLDFFYSYHKFSAVGFKLMYSQTKKFPVIIDYLKKNNVKIVFIVRENALKTLISRKTAKIRKLYHSTGKVEVTKILLSTSNIKKELYRIIDESCKWELLLTNSPFIKVVYESFIQDIKNESKRILAFLEVDNNIELTSSFQKINPDKIEDIISNFDEVKACLKNSCYERYLD